MQDYKTWVSRWLGVYGPGGDLARLIHGDSKFPISSNKAEIHKRLEALNISDLSNTTFLSSWKYFISDVQKKPKEVTLESKLVHEVERRGGLCWKFTSPGTAGVPDRIVITPTGRTIFIEMKTPGGKLQPLQKKRATQIMERHADWRLLKSNQDILVFIQEMFPDEI